MRQRFGAYSLLIFLLLPLLLLTGCGEKEMKMFMEQAMEGVAIGIVQGTTEGLTGDPDLAAQAGQDLQAKFDENRQIRELLSKLPAGWKCEGVDPYWSEEVQCMIYARPDEKWLKFNGTVWIDPETNAVAQPLIAIASAPGGESPPETTPRKTAAVIPRQAVETPAPAEEQAAKNVEITEKEFRAAMEERDIKHVRMWRVNKSTWCCDTRDGRQLQYKNGTFKEQ